MVVVHEMPCLLESYVKAPIDRESIQRRFEQQNLWPLFVSEDINGVISLFTEGRGWDGEGRGEILQRLRELLSSTHLSGEETREVIRTSLEILSVLIVDPGQREAFRAWLSMLSPPAIGSTEWLLRRFPRIV